MKKIFFFLIGLVLLSASTQAATADTDSGYHYFSDRYDYKNRAYPLLFKIWGKLSTTQTPADNKERVILIKKQIIVAKLLIQEMERIKAWFEPRAVPTSFLAFWANDSAAKQDGNMRDSWKDILAARQSNLANTEKILTLDPLKDVKVAPLADEDILKSLIAESFPDKANEAQTIAHKIIAQEEVTTSLPRNQFERANAQVNRWGSYLWAGASVASLAYYADLIYTNYKAYCEEWDQLDEEEKKSRPKKSFTTFLMNHFIAFKPFDDARLFQLAALAFAALAVYDYSQS